jgi:hypothetical protein
VDVCKGWELEENRWRMGSTARSTDGVAAGNGAVMRGFWPKGANARGVLRCVAPVEAWAPHLGPRNSQMSRMRRD